MTNNISDLLAEAKPYYFKKKRQKKIIASVASTLSVLTIVFCLSFNQTNYDYLYYTDAQLDEIAFGSNIESYGFDVDEYGFLEV
ncbi:MAG: hypothetical protein R3Y43_02830 [Alphaproteobacteria bacterium]